MKMRTADEAALAAFAEELRQERSPDELLAESIRLGNESDCLRIRAELTAQFRALVPEAEEAMAEARAAEAALEPAQAELGRVQAELAECQRRAAGAQEASTDVDLTTRIEARALRLAFEEEAASLAQQAAEQQARVREAQLVAGKAQRRVTEAGKKVAALTLAAADPLCSELGQATDAYGYRVTRGMLWFPLATGNKAHPEYAAARRALFQLLKSSGIGAEVERNAIEGRTRELESGPLVPGPDGVYTTVSQQATAAALRGARSAHPDLSSVERPGDRTAGWDVHPGIPGA